MVVVAQLVRALVCGTKGRRFESGLPPKKQKPFKKLKGFFCGVMFGFSLKFLIQFQAFFSISQFPSGMKNKFCPSF